MAKKNRRPRRVIEGEIKLKALSRLSAWLTRPGLAVADPPAARPLTTLALEIEELTWESLLEDMDRFAATFDKTDEARPRPVSPASA